VSAALFQELLTDLCARGVRILSRGAHRLRLEAPRGALGPGEADWLRANKAEFLAALQAEQPGAGALIDARVLEARSKVGAVLVTSERYGEAWLVVDRCMVGELAAEEARRPDGPRPVLLAEDVARLQGKPESVIRAALEVARAFAGTRVRQ